MEISPERGVILDKYIAKLCIVDDLRHSIYADANKRSRELASLTSALFDYRQQNNITVAELGAWRKRHVLQATSVKHAVELLGAAQ